MSGMCTLFLLLVIVGFHLIYSAFGLGFCEVLSDVEAAVDSLPVSGGRG